MPKSMSLKKKLASALAAALLSGYAVVPISTVEAFVEVRCEDMSPARRASSWKCRDTSTNWMSIIASIAGLASGNNSIIPYYPIQMITMPSIDDLVMTYSASATSSASNFASSSGMTSNSGTVSSGSSYGMSSGTSSSGYSMSAGTNSQQQQQEPDKVSTLTDSSSKDTSLGNVKAISEDSATTAIQSAVTQGFCKEPKSIQDASDCLLKFAKNLPREQKILLFAAATGDPDAKALLASRFAGLYSAFRGGTDEVDIESAIAKNLDEDAVMAKLEKQYGDYDNVIQKAGDAINALHGVRESISENGVSEEAFGKLHDYLDAKQNLINAAKSDTFDSAREYLKSEVDAAIEGNKELQKVANEKTKVEERLTKAGTRLQDMASGITTRLNGRESFTANALNRVGTNLSMLGSGSILTQLEAVKNMQEDILNVTETIYAARAEIRAAKENASSSQGSSSAVGTSIGESVGSGTVPSNRLNTILKTIGGITVGGGLLAATYSAFSRRSG